MSRRLGELVPGPARGRAALLLVVAAFSCLRLAEAGRALPASAGSWGDDLLCLPVVLTLALVIHRLSGRDAHWTLPLSHGLAVLVLYAVLFELVLPRITTAAVADPLDVVAYAAGGLFFQVALNVPGGGVKTSPPPETCGPH